MRTIWYTGVTAVLSLLIASSTCAGPTTYYMMPQAAQLGKDTSVILVGNRLQHIEQVLFFDEGITLVDWEPVEEIRHNHYTKMEPAPEGAAVKLTFRVTEDCRLGKHYFRIRTDETISEIQSLWISPYPCVEESNPFHDNEASNGEFETAQAIEIGTTVYGYS
ncbi:MAG: hypothetical protein AAF585_08015, partial [Verrucomicrobiota bacterium]